MTSGHKMEGNTPSTINMASVSTQCLWVSRAFLALASLPRGWDPDITTDLEKVMWELGGQIQLFYIDFLRLDLSRMTLLQHMS